MTCLSSLFKGAALTTALLPLALATAVSAHSAHQRFETHVTLTGFSPVELARKGHGLAPDELGPYPGPLWPLFHYEAVIHPEAQVPTTRSAQKSAQ
ncbi:hypothetical protein N6L24_06030 [Cognatishimia sp. SS12]|uniref:hypothetical protein n=1 Tax=Cognatishimia sp. SS12 TaxID=2979465 RepID=UPI00232B746A|nr:hypothetical protein [Cognatishimia sp. SS12]MDC0737828.1 hypothetical protein [Cognatishimia sp. SS12]